MRIPVFAETKATQTGRHPGRVLRRLLSNMGGWAVSGANPMRKPGGFFNKKNVHPQKDTRTKRQARPAPAAQTAPPVSMSPFQMRKVQPFPAAP